MSSCTGSGFRVVMPSSTRPWRCTHGANRAKVTTISQKVAARIRKKRSHQIRPRSDGSRSVVVWARVALVSSIWRTIRDSIGWWPSRCRVPELLATGQQRENFLHEARTAAKLKHPALVTVYEVQQDGDLIYIVQEYIEGQNLAQWAAAQPRSWEDIVRRMIEITTAIGYVHQQGFYHRDLKPGNILIDNQGHAHVADFGLAVHEDALANAQGSRRRARHSTCRRSKCAARHIGSTTAPTSGRWG